MTKGSGDARMQPLYFLITTSVRIRNPSAKRTKRRRILAGRDRSNLLSRDTAQTKMTTDRPEGMEKATPLAHVGIDKVKPPGVGKAESAEETL